MRWATARRNGGKVVVVVGRVTNGGQPGAPGVTTTVRVQCTPRLFDLPQKIETKKELDKT